MISNLINVLTAPASTYGTILDRNSWRDALLPIIILFIMAMFTGWLFQDLFADLQWTEIERRIENMTQLSEEQKSKVLDQNYQRIYGEGTGKYFSFFMMGVSWPIRILVMSLFAMLIGMGLLYKKSTKAFVYALTVLWLARLAIFSSLGAVFS